MEVPKVVHGHQAHVYIQQVEKHMEPILRKDQQNTIHQQAACSTYCGSHLQLTAKLKLLARIYVLSETIYSSWTAKEKDGKVGVQLRWLSRQKGSHIWLHLYQQRRSHQHWIRYWGMLWHDGQVVSKSCMSQSQCQPTLHPTTCQDPTGSMVLYQTHLFQYPPMVWRSNDKNGWCLPPMDCTVR